MIKQFYFKQFSLAEIHCLLKFSPEIGPYQVLPLQAKVNLGAIAKNEYSTFPNAPALLKPHNQIV